MVAALVGNQCALNQSTAQIVGEPLLRCAGHKFKLDVQRWISEQPALISS